jgi:RecA-family ATPase
MGANENEKSPVIVTEPLSGIKDKENLLKPNFPETIISPDTIIREINQVRSISVNGESKGSYSGNELLSRKIENIPTLVDPIFPAVGLVAIAGSSDTGKSSFLRQLAVSIVLGLPSFLGLQLNTKYHKAIYVSTEDDDFAVSFLLNKANKKFGRLPSEYDGLTYIFDTENLLTTIDKKLSAAPCDAFFIDAFTDLYGKSMNDSNQVRTFLNEYSQLAQKHSCLGVFLHHTGKRTEALEPSKHNLLGSQGFEAKMRMVAEIRTDPNDPAKRHLCIVKGNYLDKTHKSESYVLSFDENLLFTYTGERKPFDELKSTSKLEMKEAVINLKSQGKTQIEISQEMGISQATVSRYLNS